jgi:hypothetical protein
MDEILQRLRRNLAFWRNERNVAERALRHASEPEIERARARFYKAAANVDKAHQDLRTAETAPK